MGTLCIFYILSIEIHKRPFGRIGISDTYIIGSHQRIVGCKQIIFAKFRLIHDFRRFQVIFPVIGHALDMSQQEFGTWAAIAIHDTSSVVGAGAAYGEEALQIATTIKLTRALWIIPLALITSFVFKSKGQKISIPWFIFFFILAMVFNTYVLNSSETGIMIGEGINSLARKTLTITLFFIGASLSRDVLKAVGIKPLIQGVLLWVTISVSTLAYIYWF